MTPARRSTTCTPSISRTTVPRSRDSRSPSRARPRTNPAYVQPDLREPAAGPAAARAASCTSPSPATVTTRPGRAGGRRVGEREAHHDVDGRQDDRVQRGRASGCRAGASYPTDPGQILFATGNGGTNTVPTPGNTPPPNLGESVARMDVQSNGTLKATDFFEPYDALTLDQNDLDFGSGSPVALAEPVLRHGAVPPSGRRGGQGGIRLSPQPRQPRWIPARPGRVRAALAAIRTKRGRVVESGRVARRRRMGLYPHRLGLGVRRRIRRGPRRI